MSREKREQVIALGRLGWSLRRIEQETGVRRETAGNYLAGHDHDLQHLEFEGHPTTHFLSGGGGADLYNLKVDPSARGPFAQKVYGFSHLSVTEKQLTLRHLDPSGRILHAFTKTPDGKISIHT